ncbi:hypothetical protein J2Y69_002449 [Microbacterium resistens]|uniref:Lipoprotein n=1 Tax=Microbacterium resistens TaxID=156977 RepID=A0ABU1SE08_9MICO|nr:hypothetical protein [Microbacterium resistens]MDR6867841.1 hypothetical protein [Microbacterium resistens]
MPASHVSHAVARRSTMRGLAATTTVCLLALAVTGCGVPDAPSPTPTALFATEDEAFAAAEETYRAYVDASNDRRSGVDGVDPQSFLGGQALEDEISVLRDLRAAGKQVVGSSTLSRFAGNEFDSTSGAVEAEACIDVSATKVMTTDGQDVTPMQRPSRVGVALNFIVVDRHPRVVDSRPDETACL